MSNFKVKQIRKFEKNIDEFFNNLKSEYNFIERNYEILNWRYNSFKHKYTYESFIVSDDKEKIVGYFVLGVCNEYVKVCEFFTFKKKKFYT